MAADQPLSPREGLPSLLAECHSVQVTRGRASIDRLCEHLGIADSLHLPKTFRSLLPCTAVQPGVVAMPAHVLARHHVNGLFWAAMEPFVMRLASGRAVLEEVAKEDAFEKARSQWVQRSGLVTAKMKTEEQLAEQAVQARCRHCLWAGHAVYGLSTGHTDPWRLTGTACRLKRWPRASQLQLQRLRWSSSNASLLACTVLL